MWQMNKSKIISEYMRNLGQKSHRLSPRPPEFYARIGKKGGLSKNKKEPLPKE